MSQDEKRLYFAKRQEACRKDIERSFGVLHTHFAIIRNSCRQWNMDTISNIMFGCCILYNMMIEDESCLGLENVLLGLGRRVV